MGRFSASLLLLKMSKVTFVERAKLVVLVNPTLQPRELLSAQCPAPGCHLAKHTCTGDSELPECQEGRAPRPPAQRFLPRPVRHHVPGTLRGHSPVQRVHLGIHEINVVFLLMLQLLQGNGGEGWQLPPEHHLREQHRVGIPGRHDLRELPTLAAQCQPQLSPPPGTVPCCQQGHGTSYQPARDWPSLASGV